MTTFKDWDNEIDKLGTDEIAKFNQALETLLGWDFFKKAYDGYGLPVVNTMLARATDARLNRDERRAAELTFTVVDSWSKPNRTWTWDKLAALDRKGRKMMDATLTAAFAQMVINDPGIKNHIITV